MAVTTCNEELLKKPPLPAEANSDRIKARAASVFAWFGTASRSDDQQQTLEVACVENHVTKLVAVTVMPPRRSPQST